MNASTMSVIQSAPGQTSTLERGLQLGLLAVLFGMYCGVMPYLLLVSFSLLYGVYLVIGTCAGGIMAGRWPASRNLFSVAPYFCWLIFYFYWGTVVAPEDLKLGEVFKTVLKNALVISTICVALSGPSDLRKLATLVQVAVLINFGVALYETRNPDLIPQLAYMTSPDTTAFGVTRPAGLWSNPNEAAFAYLFGIFLSFWATKPMRWIGFLSGLGGLWLCASRTGVYVLLLCAAVALAVLLRRRHLGPGMAGAMVLGCLPALLVLPLLVDELGNKTGNIPQLHRLLDASEASSREADAPSRVQVAINAWNHCIEGPWHGYGLFAFQNSESSGTSGVLDIAAHNVFLTVLGEGGAFCLLSYLAVLGLGFWRVTKLEGRDQLLMGLMWLSYLIIGLTWHNQFTSFAGMIYVGLLFHLPVLLRKPVGGAV